MDFTYFKGPIDDMGDLLKGRHKCSICDHEHEYCFDLEYCTTDKFAGDTKRGKTGCYECLRKGAFEFWHDTEYGMLNEKGLYKIYSHNMDNPPKLPEISLLELRRTPPIVTYQQEIWLTHCNDFMVYKGTWQPLDFYTNSSTGDGRDLFMEMTGKDMTHLWDESLEEGQTLLEQWYPTYYVFECRHCQKLRGYWDCD
jgi:uncharacterized protein CbrC (UPF0167 family)